MTVKNAWQFCLLVLIFNVSVLCDSVASAKTQSTGTLWEHCDSFQHLPKGIMRIRTTVNPYSVQWTKSNLVACLISLIFNSVVTFIEWYKLKLAYSRVFCCESRTKIHAATHKSELFVASYISLQWVSHKEKPWFGLMNDC